MSPYRYAKDNSADNSSANTPVSSAEDVAVELCSIQSAAVPAGDEKVFAAIISGLGRQARSGEMGSNVALTHLALVPSGLVHNPW